MASFWFWNPALYWNCNETLQCMCSIKKPPHGICQPRYQGEAMVRDVHLYICNAQGLWSNMNSHCWLEFVCWVCQRPSQHSLCHGCSAPGNPAEFPAVGATPAAPLSLLWSLQGKGAPFWWPPCTPVEPWHHFPSCCLIFQNGSVPTQLGFFSSQIRSCLSYCNMFPSLELGIVTFTYISLSQSCCCISQQEYQ